MFRYFSMFILLTAMGILYEKYKLKYEPDEELKKYDMVKKFFLNGNVGTDNKPILWIHTDHPINGRSWSSFGSRNTRLLNQPYKVSCVETIIKHCSKSFNICLIDDYSFQKLIPGWSVNMDKMSDPVKSHIRLLALSKLLRFFGGFLLPNSTIVCKDLKPLYDNALNNADCFSVMLQNRNNMANYKSAGPSTKIMGCKKNSAVMGEFINYLERLNSIDYTNESDFLGKPNAWLYGKYTENTVFLISGKMFGAEDKNGKEVGIDRLMGNTFIEFAKNKCANYIPDDAILKRTKYEWFARLSQQQLRNCENIAAKQLLVAQG